MTNCGCLQVYNIELETAFFKSSSDLGAVEKARLRNYILVLPRGDSTTGGIKVEQYCGNRFG